MNRILYSTALFRRRLYPRRFLLTNVYFFALIGVQSRL